MKMMPTNDLIAIIENYDSADVVSKGFLDKIFDNYGDDYFRDPGGEWELCNVSEPRQELLKEIESIKRVMEGDHDQR